MLPKWNCKIVLLLIILQVKDGEDNIKIYAMNRIVSGKEKGLCLMIGIMDQGQTWE